MRAYSHIHAHTLLYTNKHPQEHIHIYARKRMLSYTFLHTRLLMHTKKHAFNVHNKKHKSDYNKIEKVVIF